jgi:hypothetical protein
MPDVCGTKRASVPESTAGCFTKVGILSLCNIPGYLFLNPYILWRDLNLYPAVILVGFLDCMEYIDLNDLFIFIIFIVMMVENFKFLFL